MAVMADDKQTSALVRRHEQVKRWEDSDSNIEPNSCRENKKVKFQNGCVFLAACSSGDREEVKKLLASGADINTPNVDGLTALHQACIDDNLDMIEFLVEKNSDIDVCDNEGWTPLHATASCGFTEIARYLIEAGANVAAVNNDGDLPIDISEDDDMERLLQDVMTKQGVDAEAARREEEETMLADANRMLNCDEITEIRHPKTGATSLHVASAKGYMKVISILLQAGVDVNSKDNDGWTPIHAAAHWGQDEACKLLAEYMCDLEKKNNAGQTPFDVADSDMLQLLDELRKKQAARKDKNSIQEIIQNKGLSQKRRSSVTRMSVDQKQNVISKNTEQERATLDANLNRKNKEIENEIKPEKEEKIVRSSSSSGSEEESSESETEKQNEKNRQTSSLNQPRDRDKPIPAMVEGKKPDMPKIDEVNEIGHIKSNDSKASSINIIAENGSGDHAGIELSIKDNKRTEPEEREKDEKDSENQKQRQTAAEESDKSDRISTQRELLSRSISAPPNLPPTTQVSQLLPQGSEVDQNPHQMWCSGLMRTGSTSMVIDSLIKDNNMMDKSLPRSASSPRLAHDNNTVGNDNMDKPTGRRPMHSTSSVETEDGKPTDRYSSVYSRGTTFPYRNLTSISPSSTYQSAYVPYYRRKQEQNDRREREKAGEPVIATAPAALTKGITPPTSIAVTTRGPTQATMTLPSAAVTSTTTATSQPTTIQNTVITTATTTTPTISSTTPSSNYITSYRRSFYEPPKREEETETQRKVRAKRARETRRSTQGVTLEEVKQAEQILSATKEREDKLKEQRKEEESVKDRLGVSSIHNKDKKDNILDDASSRRRTVEDKQDDESRSSYRRSREARDLSSSVPSISTDSSSPRQRNALSTSDINAGLRGSAGISRTSSLRDRLRNGEADKKPEEDTRKDINEEKPREKEERKELSAIKARRARRERRSTGIASYTAENEDDKDKENKEDSKEEKKDTDEKGLSSRYGSRYGSSGDVLQTSLPDRYSRADRPTSYTDFSKSTPSLDSDYKRLYEDEKIQKERLKKDLERTKKELSEAKLELDRLMRRNESARFQDTTEKREKRALERKLSELEEEVKKMDKLKEEYNRLREENGALIRVISKLSK